MIIETARLRLRPVDETDAPAAASRTPQTSPRTACGICMTLLPAPMPGSLAGRSRRTRVGGIQQRLTVQLRAVVREAAKDDLRDRGSRRQRVKSTRTT